MILARFDSWDSRGGPIAPESEPCARGFSAGPVIANSCLARAEMRITPAMLAGVTDRLWSFDELLSGAVA